MIETQRWSRAEDKIGRAVSHLKDEEVKLGRGNETQQGEKATYTRGCITTAKLKRST